jgi:hypothetical protein
MSFWVKTGRSVPAQEFRGMQSWKRVALAGSEKEEARPTSQASPAFPRFPRI